MNWFILKEYCPLTVTFSLKTLNMAHRPPHHLPLLVRLAHSTLTNINLMQRCET